MQLKQLCLSKMATNICYTGRLDWGAGHLPTIIVGTGGRAFDHRCRNGGRGVLPIFLSARGLPGGMLAAGIDSHITLLYFILTCSVCLSKFFYLNIFVKALAQEHKCSSREFTLLQYVCLPKSTNVVQMQCMGSVVR